MAAKRHEGVVVRVLADKGYAFVSRPDGLADIFLHCSAIDAPFDELLTERKITFEETAGANGKLRCAYARLVE